MWFGLITILNLHTNQENSLLTLIRLFGMRTLYLTVERSILRARRDMIIVPQSGRNIMLSKLL